MSLYRPAAQRARELDLRGFEDEPVCPEPQLTAEQQLAGAVLAQALADARDAKLPKANRDQARYFLTRSDGLRFWCEIAGLELHTVSSLATKVLAREPMVGSPGGMNHGLTVQYK
jgi:hypothetical protein